MANPSLEDVSSRLERLESLISRIPGGGVTDPGPDPLGGFGGWRPRWTIPFPFPFPHPGDPAPMDLSRFTRAQLAVTKEMLKTERFRLEAMEKLVDEQMKSMGK